MKIWFTRSDAKRLRSPLAAHLVNLFWRDATAGHTTPAAFRRALAFYVPRETLRKTIARLIDAGELDEDRRDTARGWISIACTLIDRIGLELATVATAMRRIGDRFRKTLAELRFALPWWTEQTIGRKTRALADAGLLEIRAGNRDDRTNTYVFLTDEGDPIVTHGRPDRHAPNRPDRHGSLYTQETKPKRASATPPANDFQRKVCALFEDAFGKPCTVATADAIETELGAQSYPWLLAKMRDRLDYVREFKAGPDVWAGLMLDDARDELAKRRARAAL